MPDTQQFWFAARTRKGQELTIRKSLEKLGIEHFIPTHTVTRQLKYRKKRVEVPVIRNLIFLRATLEAAMSIPNDHAVPLFYIRDYISHRTLIVPDRQMQDFIFVMDTSPTQVTFDDSELKPGVKVEVIKGNLCGLQGEFAALGNKAYVIIRIPQVLAVNVQIPKSHLRIIKEDQPFITKQ